MLNKIYEVCRDLDWGCRGKREAERVFLDHLPTNKELGEIFKIERPYNFWLARRDGNIEITEVKINEVDTMPYGVHG